MSAVPRILAPFLGLLIASMPAAADPRPRLEIRGASAGGGKLHVSVFDGEAAYSARRPCKIAELEPMDAAPLLLDLPEGEYLVWVFQDLDGDGDLDSSFLGIPKEPVGLSAWDGKGPPGGFGRHKVRLGGDAPTVVLRLFSL
ncbi:MAG TPA: DUF2141 domain-containing protein [Spirochaetia bacterium]|nr:DUF2141 domain-containing protein [Spirochaetia bacterium]